MTGDPNARHGHSHLPGGAIQNHDERALLVSVDGGIPSPQTAITDGAARVEHALPSDSELGALLDAGYDQDGLDSVCTCDIPPRVSELSHRVETTLSAFLQDGLAKSRRMDASYPPLWAGLTQALTGGKRIRPRLVLGAYLALAAEDAVPEGIKPALESGVAGDPTQTRPAAASSATAAANATATATATAAAAATDSRLSALVATAAAQELLHGAFVVHDDIIDGDLLRRGKPNLTGAILAEHPLRESDPARARRDAESSAIIGGDLLLSAAQRHIALLDVDTRIRHRLLDLFDEAVHITAGGEHADVSLAALESGSPSITRILNMTEHKTASYTFSVPLRAGAVLAGADENLLGALDEVARALGLAFQLQDDHLGVFGESARTGKSITADLSSGKNTALVSLARDSTAWPLIVALQHAPESASAAQWEQVRSELVRAGVRERHDALVADATRRAQAATLSPALPPRLRSYLTSVIIELGGRDV
ncbi:geranylgeranyl diphosphate synthase type II [Mycetocola sp. BIGb0189]|uniref:polyprenyl synthetase family protein n=1 Tax=Mycetocola sp. BIGb0189 TaxID=2940604 RepID=UPI00216A02B4|nr:polyprenyl synthetase family protein [Mycetocola sp. BIGb0189]MCS4276894.1 geranylgeranyl diphosphate synthase type II [Mycetocola sp. BIGb0189]